MRLLAMLWTTFAGGCGDEAGGAGPCAGIDCSPGTCVPEGASARCSCPPGYDPLGLECVPEGGDSDTDTDTDADSDTDTDTESDTTPCPDLDEDGFSDVACGGDDCNDGRDDIHPFAYDSDGWAIDDVDADATAQWGNVSVAADGDEVHVCYFDDNVLHHASRVDGVWSIADGRDTSDYSPLGTCSIAVADGIVHLVWDRDNGATTDTMYGTGTIGDGVRWGYTTLDSTGFGQSMPALDLDTDGDPHVVYRRNCEVIHTRRDIDDWPVSVIDPDEGCGPFGGSIDVEQWGNVRLAWIGRDSWLRFAHNQGGWDVTRLSETSGGSTAVLNLGDAHVAYSDVDNDIAYEAQEALVWQPPRFVWDGFAPSMARDSADRVHMVLRSGDGPAVYAGLEDDRWYYLTIAEGGTHSPDIAASGDGLHVAYRDLSDGVRHAFRAFADAVDQNCDGMDGVDADGDSHASRASWGDDCNDADPDITTDC